jgi:hypothetical protein
VKTDKHSRHAEVLSKKPGDPVNLRRVAAPSVACRLSDFVSTHSARRRTAAGHQSTDTPVHSQRHEFRDNRPARFALSIVAGALRAMITLTDEWTLLMRVHSLSETCVARGAYNEGS